MKTQYDLSELKDDPHRILGVAENAPEDIIRGAYLEKIKAWPPERFPVEFEQIRDAYKILKDPKGRTLNMIHAGDPEMPLTGLLDKIPAERHFSGPQIWLDAMKAR